MAPPGALHLGEHYTTKVPLSHTFMTRKGIDHGTQQHFAAFTSKHQPASPRDQFPFQWMKSSEMELTFNDWRGSICFVLRSRVLTLQWASSQCTNPPIIMRFAEYSYVLQHTVNHCMADSLRANYCLFGRSCWICWLLAVDSESRSHHQVWATIPCFWFLCSVMTSPSSCPAVSDLFYHGQSSEACIV